MKLSNFFKKIFLLLTILLVGTSVFAQVDIYRGGVKKATLANLSEFNGSFALQKDDVLEFQSDMVLDVSFGESINIDFILNGNGHRLIFTEGAGTLFFKGAYIRFNNVIVDGSDAGFHGVVFGIENKAHLEMDDDVRVVGFENSVLIDLRESLVTGGVWENNNSSSPLVKLHSSTLNRVKFQNNSVRGEGEVSLFSLDNSSIVNSIVAENEVSTVAPAQGILIKHIGEDCSIINSTFTQNSVDGFLDSENCKIHNSILYQSGDFSSVTAFMDHCVTTDPKLNSDYSLRFSSPCIDAGSDAWYNSRRLDFGELDSWGDSRFEGASIDVGACEFRKRCKGSPLKLDILSSEAKCFGVDDGVIRGSVSGGVAPYTFAWFLGDQALGQRETASIEIDGLADGNYTLLVTDALGCEQSKLVSIQELTQKITVKAVDSTKIYDGKSLEQKKYVVIGELEEGDVVADVEIEGVITDAGSAANVVKSFRILRGEEDVTCYYDTVMGRGTLTITPLEVKVTIAGHTKTTVYNGEEQDTTGYEWSANSTLYQAADFSYAGDSIAAGKEIGTYQMNLAKEQFKNKNQNYDVTFEVSDGWLKIDPLEVKVTIAGHTKTTVYNGEEQDTTGYEWSANSTLYQADDFSYAGDSIAAGKEIGTYAMNLKKENFANNNNNYDVTFEVTDGWLKIDPLEVKVTIAGHTKTTVYNGEEQDTTGYEWSANSALYQAADFSYAGDSTAAGKEIGTYQMNLTKEQFTNKNQNYDVTFEVSDGWLKIDPLEVKVTIAGHTKTTVYNGEEQDTTGYEWSSNSALYQAADFSYEGDSLAKGKEIGTYAMNLKKENFTNNNNNYDVTFEVTDGWLKIDPLEVKVTIAGHTKTTVYNGEEQDTTGYEWSANSTLYQAADFSYAGDSIAAGKEIGTYQMNLTKEQFTNKNQNYDVTFEVSDGWLKIDPLEVKVTIAGHTKTTVYSGEEQDTTGYEWSANSTLYQAADFSYAGDSIAAGKEIGTYQMNLTKEQFTNKNQNYDVTFEVSDGWLKIDPLEVKVTIAGHTKTTVYNGEEQDTTGYEWSANSALYQAADFSYEGDSLAKGKEIGTYAMNLKKENFTNNNDNYDVTFEVTDGWLKIDPLEVKVTIAGHTKTTIYNGEEQDTTGYEWSANSTLYQAADFSYAGDSIAAGKEIGTYQMNLTKEQFTNKNDNYEVTFEVTDGWLKIDPLEVKVTIAGHTQTTVYNGEEQDTTGYEWSANSTLYQAADFSYAGDSLAKGKEIGTYAMNLKKENFANNNNNYDVTFEVTDGWLKIDPLEVKVTIAGHAKTTVYNGEEQDTTGYEWSANSTLYQAADFSYAGDSTAKGTEIGTYQMNLTKEQFKNKNQNYDVTFEVSDGWLKIDPLEVKVTIAGHTKTTIYNGEEQDTTGYEWSANSTLYQAADFSYEGDSLAKGKEIGTYQMNLTKEQFKNKNDNYDVTFEVSDGWLKIDPLEVKVTIAGHTKTTVYNGEEQDTTGYEWSANSTLYQAADFSYAGDSTAKGTEIGTYQMNLTKEQFKNKNDNYDVTFEVSDGWLKIDPLEVKVTIAGHTKTTVYNGEEQDTTGYEWKASTELYKASDFSYAGDSTVKGTDVNTYAMGLKSEDFANKNNNYTVEFVITQDGSLTIQPLNVIVKITGNKKELPYNGYAQQVTGFSFEADTDLYKKSDFKYSQDSVASGVTVGSYPMNLKSEQFSNTNANFGEVTFVIESDGNLTITPISTPITITASSSKITYDGSPLTDDGYRYTPNVLVAGDVLTAVVEGSITNVGEKANVVTSYRVIHTDEETGDKLDVTDNYTFTTPVEGKLIVTKRTVLLRSESAEKTYDGQPLTEPTVNVVGDESKEGFVYGEGAIYTVTGSITEIGSAENEFTYKLRSNTKADNYDIQVEYGTLTVLAIEKALVITANSASKIYDGTPLTDAGFAYTSNVLAKGDSIIAVVSGEVTQTGSAKNQVKEIKVVRGTLDVTKNYTIGTSVDGLLTILPRTVVLTSATEEKVYDRMPLANATVTVGGDGFAPGEGATFVLENSITEPGSVVNHFTYTLKENTSSDNYLIKTVEGTLTVTKRPTAILFDYGYNVKSDTLSGYADEAYDAPSDPVRKGYDFLAWDTPLPLLLPLDTLSVEALWKLLTYTVTLDTFSHFTYTVEDHKEIDLATYAPVREGYDFTGWVDETGTQVTHVNTSDTRSMALTATWQLATFHIDYLSDGELWKRVSVKYGESLVPSAAPVRIGYLFKGWDPVLPSTMPAKDLKVEAKWSIITFNLFLVDEGRDAGTITYTVEDGDFYLDALDERPGQMFNGWTLDGEPLDYEEQSDRYIFHPDQVASDVTVEASWTIVSNEFTLEYRVDNVKYKSFRIMVGNRTRQYVASVRTPQAKAGYQFDGWDIDVPEYMPRKDLVVNAVWKPINYRLVLKSAEGAVMYSTQYTIEDEVLLPQLEDVEEKLDFIGWSDGTKIHTTFDPKNFMSDVELVAVWERKSFQMIYYVGNDIYARDTFYVGDSIVKLPDPDDYIEGYAFSGWSETPLYMPARNVNVTSYYARGGYTLTYMSEGQVVKSVRYLYDAPISPSRGVSKYGYNFKYWAGVPQRMPAKDIEVEAVYDVATYYIALSNGSEVVDTLYYTIYDQDLLLPTLDERGKVFRGWNDGKQNITKIAKGSYANNLELVANWLYINYTLVFEVDGVQYSKKNNMRCGDVIALPREPSKAGAEFVRWEGMPVDGLMPDADLTLRAVFSSQVGDSMTEQTPSVKLYAKDRVLHLLNAEGTSVQVVDLNGVTLFKGIATASDYEIPLHYHGLYLVKVGKTYHKVVVK